MNRVDLVMRELLSILSIRFVKYGSYKWLYVFSFQFYRLDSPISLQTRNIKAVVLSILSIRFPRPKRLNTPKHHSVDFQFYRLDSEHLPKYPIEGTPFVLSILSIRFMVRFVLGTVERLVTFNSIE